MSRSEAWVTVQTTPRGYAVRFGAADDLDFRDRLGDFKASVPWAWRRFDRHEREWSVDAAAGAALRRWVVRWFDPEQRTVPVEWTERRSASPPPPPRSDTRTDAYATLWLRPGAPPEVVRAAYRALAQLHHPDVGGDTETMKRVNGAFDALRKGAA